MNMTKTFKKVGVLAIVLLMIAALVGCGGNQGEKQWEEDVTAIMNDITLSQTDFNTALAGIQPGDADSQTAMLNAIDTLEEDFNALKAVEAPEKYQAVQEEFNTAVDKALEGTAAFREMANNLGDGGDLTIVSDKLSEGQTKYEEFLELWQTAVNNLAEIARLNLNRYKYEGAVADDSATAPLYAWKKQFHTVLGLQGVCHAN